jgi:hypothetical protein
MKSEIEKYELIEQFLTGKLPAEEHTGILKRIASDPLFAKEVKDHQQIISFVLDSSFDELKSELKKIYSVKIRKSKLRNRRLKLGLGFGLILISFLLYLFFSHKPIHPVTEIPVSQKSPVTSSSDAIEKTDNIDRKTGISSENTLKETDAKNEIDPLKNQVQLIPDIPDKPTLEEKKITNLFTNEKNDEVLPEKEVIIPRYTDDTSRIAKPYDCSTVSIFAVVNTIESCDNEPTGSIAIEESSISGGTPPYEISIDNKTNFHRVLSYNALPPKQYAVWIRDHHECMSWLGNYEIEMKKCGYNDLFAPGKGEKWDLPNQGLACHIRIYDQNGILVHEASYTYPGTYSWDGYSNSGTLLTMGVYTFILQIENKPTLKGNITIVR